MQSVLIQTLGCKLNQLESEAAAEAFSRSGFTIYNTSKQVSPSIIIVNTCTVTSKADQKARRVIRKALRDYPDSCVLVTGCYAQLDHEYINQLDPKSRDRIFVLKGMEKEKLLDLPDLLYESEDVFLTVKRWFEESEQGSHPSHPNKIFQFSPKHFSTHTRGSLKIQDGCDKHCTYCRIRLARGPSVSLPAEQALARLRVLEENHAEAVLTGVNIGQYRDKSANLGELLEYLLSGTNKISLRLSSLAPDSVNENFVKILSNKRIRPHFHLSIQSGSEKVLEKMGRSYNSETIEKAVTLLRHAREDPFLACDLIAGFPGETEAEFEKTRKLCQKADFAWIHVFPYSKRRGTPAWSFPDSVNEKEISKRTRILTDFAWQGRAGYVQRWIGREVDVLIEKNTGGFCRGVSENYLKLLVRYNGNTPPPPGSVLRCRILAFQGEIPKDYDTVAQELAL